MDQYLHLIEEKIKSLRLEQLKPHSLYSPIAYTMDAGGKRLRPVLALMSCQAFGGAAEQALDAAVGVEMFHNFTLLHDDVMDNSDTRRGRPTVHKKWDTNIAILSGDAMLTLATMLVAKVPENVLSAELEIFNRGAMDVYEGQALDMDFETRTDVAVEEYLDMISKKTGALLATACMIGAVVGGADESAARCMYDFGMALGMGFQIWDDYLDVYGDPATFGKPIGGDILNEKKTYLWLSLFNHPDATVRAEAERCLALQGHERIDAFRRLYTRIGLPQLCLDLTKRYAAEGDECLRRAGIPGEWQQRFRQLSDKLTGRQK